MTSTAVEALERIGVGSIRPDRIVGSLSLAERQLVEIAKVLTLRKARVLVFDEPTAALNHHDVERLFTIMRGLRDAGRRAHLRQPSLPRGAGDLRRRHGPAERPRGRDRASRRGQPGAPRGADARPAGRGDVRPHVADAMAGRDRCSRSAACTSARASAASTSRSDGARSWASAACSGPGQNELARAICGDAEDVSGDVRLAGLAPRARDRHARRSTPAPGSSPRTARTRACSRACRCLRNISVASLARIVWSRGAAPRARPAGAGARRFGGRADRHRVRACSRDQVMTLSGGNQQKSILARWLMRGCALLVCIEPTRGVDVGAKAEIYRELEGLARDGTGILVVSTDLPEVLGHLRPGAGHVPGSHHGAARPARPRPSRTSCSRCRAGRAGEREGLIARAGRVSGPAASTAATRRRRASRARCGPSPRPTGRSSWRSSSSLFCALTADVVPGALEPAQHPHPDLGRGRGCHRRHRRAARGRASTCRWAASCCSGAVVIGDLAERQGLPLPVAHRRRPRRRDGRGTPVRLARGGRPRRVHPRDARDAAAVGRDRQAHPRTGLDRGGRRLLRLDRPRPDRSSTCPRWWSSCSCCTWSSASSCSARRSGGASTRWATTRGRRPSPVCRSRAR